MVLRLGMVTTSLPKARDGHHMSALALGLLGLGPSGPNPTGPDLATRLVFGPFEPKLKPALRKDLRPILEPKGAVLGKKGPILGKKGAKLDICRPIFGKTL